jgi:hypothetical protein
MVVALVVLAFFVGGLFGSLAMALACAAHDAESRRPVADGRHVEVKLARRQPLRRHAA